MNWVRQGHRGRDQQLTTAIRTVRNRWRFAIALRGLAVVVGTTLLVIVAVAMVMDALRYAPSAVVVARVIVWTALAALLARFLVLPLLRRVPDERVALYMEEREPTLDAAVVTAVELEASKSSATPSAYSGALARRVIDSTTERVHRLGDGRQIERTRLTRESAVLAVLAVAGIATILLGPAALRRGARLLVPWQTAEAASPYRLAVQPGNIAVPRGGDLKIETRLHGFQSERVELVVKAADSASWTRTAMTAEGDSGSSYVTRLFDITQQTEYYVETGGLRSPTYRIDVTDMPYSKRIDLEYRYPAYTGLPPENVENGGDIAALRGTQVIVRVTPTRPARAGRLVVEGGSSVTLAPDSAGVLSGTLRVDKPGFYKVELEAPGGRMLTASLDYTIDVLEDRPPTVRLTKPGRDVKATSVEEVFVEAVAQDDFGVASLELVYTVNGGAEQRRALSATSGASRETSGSHTFLLEELELEPGDVISYYARATDNNRVGGAATASTDIYFLQIRPFAQDYRQQQAGGGGGGGGGDQPGQLSQRQREIIAGTFKTERDRKTTPARQFQEDVTTLALAQSRLREQADQLARRLVQRGIAGEDSNYAKIAEILPKAVAEMRTAEATLGRRDTKGALAPEQRALLHLQRAEAVFREIQVSMGGDGGGGDGGEQQSAEDLADLFELERDKMRNQYEQVERGRQEQQQQADNQVDEALERLKQLASRQQQENERLRRKADSLRAQQSNTQGGGGSSQRQLAEQAEETARQLERLAREQSSPQLAESARRLQQAADAMRRSASTDGARSLADANDALERLKDARRLLDRERDGRANRDAADALKTARELADEQRRIADAQRQLGAQPGSGASDRERALSERKDGLADRVRDFKSQLDRSAMEARRDKPQTARQMQDAANALRDRKTEEKIRYSRGLIGRGDPEQAQALEGAISADLDSTARVLERAVASAGSENGRREGEALDRARELTRGLASLDERMRAREDGASRQQSGQQQSGQQQSGQQQSGQQQSGQQPSGQQGDQPAGRLQDGQRQGSQTQGGGPPNAAQTGPPRGRASSARMTTEDIRQFQREVRERLAEAEALRRDLRAQGRDVAELDRLIGQLRGLGGAMGGANPGETAGLRAAVVEGFKAFEFALRRDLEGEKERLLLGRSGDVPPGFKQLVEEYYKSLAGHKSPR